MSTSIPAEAFRPLFEPRGVVVAGASTHPGKFGFVALHNIIAAGYGGQIFATNRDRGTILGIPTLGEIDELPDGAVDLVIVCTPAATNVELLRSCARKGIRAAFVASAGYAESGPAGRIAQEQLAATAAECGILLIGPNGQGIVSTPASLCAQIVAPFPPAGSIGIASQSGNFSSSFMNYAVHSGVGISRSVSAGNSAAVTVVDLLHYYAADPATSVGLAYIEGVQDGRQFFDEMLDIGSRLPLVVLKGGASTVGAKAAASHTGSLASDDRIFDAACRQAGIVRASTVEEAYEAAATFATQPPLRGPNVAVVSTAGGWGVVTADAIAASRHLRLAPLPDDLLTHLDTMLPARWSRSNPVDMAGGETKDTIPNVLEAVARHDAVDAVIFLGMGIQGNQAAFERNGGLYPEHGLERIVDYHERQERRFTETAARLSRELGKPILVATELAMTAPDNAAVVGVRELGGFCYSSSNRAVTALEHLWRHSRYRQRRNGEAAATS